MVPRDWHLLCHPDKGAAGKGVRARTRRSRQGLRSTRALAVELANSAGDFPLLERLADAELRHAPGSAGSWTFKLSVAMRTTGYAELKALVATMPEALTGAPRQHAQLSQVEFRYGDKRKAMRRVYRMYRQDVESVDAVAAYVVPMLGSGADLPYMEVELEVVAAGSTVTLQEEHGRVMTVPIDPDDVVVPTSSKFWRPQAPEVAPALGAVVGQSVALPGAWGLTGSTRSRASSPPFLDAFALLIRVLRAEPSTR